jgi:hypothetical protein
MIANQPAKTIARRMERRHFNSGMVWTILDTAGDSAAWNQLPCTSRIGSLILPYQQNSQGLPGLPSLPDG